MISLEKLFKAGVHFGHQKRRWSPKMAPYIWGYKNNIHLIDISKTALQLEKASKFLKGLASEGKTVLWVGTKRPAQNVIEQAAKRLDMPYVNHRWIGGTLSNFAQVKKSVTKYLHYNDVLAKADKYPHYTKKELNTIQKAAARLEQNVGGILHLSWPVGALVVVDAIKERSALREAATMGVPVVALVDTNADPSMVDIVVPTNDDSPRAIQVLVEYMADAVEAGRQEHKQKVQEEKEQKELERLAAKKEKEAKAPKKEKAEAAEPKKAAEKKPAVKKENKAKEAAAPKKEAAKKPAAKKPAAKKTEAKSPAKKSAKK